MKKLLIGLLVFILSLTAMLTLFSCGNEEEEEDDAGSLMCPEGQHQFQHWEIEKEALCNEKGIQFRKCIKCKIKTEKRYYSDLDNHNLVEGNCTRCDYTTAPKDVIFTLSNDGKYYILTSVEDKSSEEYIVPSIYDGLPVREIAEGAFADCTYLEHVTVPNSVNTIGLGAFKGCFSLKSMTLPFIGKDKSDDFSVFGYIFGNVTYPGSLGIEQTASDGRKDYWIPASLSDIVIESGYLYEGCFENCSMLKNITYNGDAKRIYDRAFSGCRSLEYVTMPEKIEKVGDRAFQNCYSLKVVPLVEGVESIGDYCFAGCSFEYLNLPTTLTDIGDCAFVECNYLTSIFIPKNIENVGNNMFQDCSLLSKVEFENGVKTIGEAAFSGCENLKTVIFSETIEEIGELAFKDCVGIESIDLYCFTIGNGAFQGCISLSSVSFEYGLEEIGELAFSKCTLLSDVYLPATLKTLGENAFAECDSLKVFNIDENNNNFAEIDGIIYSKDKTTLILYSPGNNQESFVMPEGVTTIYSGAFDNAKFLKEVVFPTSMKEIPDNLFLQNQTIKSVVISGGIVKIGEKAFAGCTALESVTIKNVELIGESAFTQCNMLKFVDIDGATTIGKGAFYACPSITDITLKNIELIDENAFAECYSLVNLEIGQGVLIIGAEAFTKCTALEELVIGSSVTSIGEFTFSDCANLKNVNIHRGLISIGEACFRNCAKLETVYIPSSLETVNAYAFEGCVSLVEFQVSEANSKYTALDGHLVTKSDMLVVFCPGKITEEVTIPDGIVSLGTFLFRNVKTLKKVNFPSSLVEIGNEAFYNSGIESIDLNRVQTIGEYAFGKCLKLKNVTIAKSVTTIMEYAFQDSIYIENFYVRNTLVNVGTAIFHVTDTLKKDLGLKEIPQIYVFIEYNVLPETWDEGWNNGGNVIFLMGHYFAD